MIDLRGLIKSVSDKINSTVNTAKTNLASWKEIILRKVKK